MIYHGAKWWKFDFHTHTPKSIDYGKGTNYTVLQQRTPREWLLDYMGKEIDCVAVTDHNSGHWIDVLKNELVIMREEQLEGFREITIFPGVEITVHGNIHLLAIFDPSETSEYISNLLARCEYFGQPGDSDQCTRKSFNEVVEIILQMKGLPIPAHVDTVRGLFVEEQGNSLRTCLNTNGLLAIQVCDENYSKPQIYIDSKLMFAEVAGSDSHHPDSAGSSYTWVKMESPDLEALRLALHDGEDGIIRNNVLATNPNEVRERFYIQSIEITNGAKAGRGKKLNVNFSPWLNTIIGGRGSGKSSIIEYMRLPFSKVNGLPEKIDEQFNEFNKVPKERGKTGMLTDSTVIRVQMQKDGREIVLKWENNKIIEEQLNENGVWERKEESSNVESRFPVRIFSQKHLYSLTEDPNHILKIIDEQFDKNRWIEIREELTKKWMQSRAKQRDLKSKISEKGNIKAEFEDTLAKMKVFEESGHKTLLEEYQKTQATNNTIVKSVTKIDTFSVKLKDIVKDIPSNLFDEECFSLLDQASIDMLRVQSMEYEVIKNAMVDLVSRTNQLIEKTKEVVDDIPWQQTRMENEQKYFEFVRKLEEQGEKNPNAYGELSSKSHFLQQKLKDIATLEEQLKQQDEIVKQYLDEIHAHEIELRTQRNNVISRWQGSNSNVKMHLSIMGDIDNAETSFRSLIRKPGTEFSRDILERDDEGNPMKGFLLNITSSTSVWRSREELIVRILKASEEETQNFNKPFVKHLTSLKFNTPEDMDRLFIWYPEDKISLKLVTNRKEEDIETGSAGQRTAAMLSLMLLLDDSPIIIDQPEEDLDTKRITDLVVTELRRFKTKQQVIVVTHNPNIPVNGAAENIIQMNFENGQIYNQVSGALQKSDVREAVCNIMEGGKDALDRRYFRISRAMEK
ncbi:TrlF family AAA-like ATPase [Paenibacillus sp. BR1-192]|uniref:TrlF family AAA-like ATPase n=1 Tax=Paenibacillus sp. BR1-192 TaxID=3032287 RepID=UPI00240D0DAD|nr:AAA family ATPase [Paenibacillus sp. BR1-192]WFB58557.1 AAA family ATPase [Paenibacillus sp. BR1-192]